MFGGIACDGQFGAFGWCDIVSEVIWWMLLGFGVGELVSGLGLVVFVVWVVVIYVNSVVYIY